MIEEGSILTLGENHRYLVAFSTMYDNKNYIFVTNVDNMLDTCFYEYTGGTNLSLVTNQKLLNKLLKEYKKEKLDN